MGLVLELSDKRAVAASEVAQRHRLAMADAVMYSMALEHQAAFLTQDRDYQGLPGVHYFPKSRICGPRGADRRSSTLWSFFRRFPAVTSFQINDLQEP